MIAKIIDQDNFVIFVAFVVHAVYFFSIDSRNCWNR